MGNFGYTGMRGRCDYNSGKVHDSGGADVRPGEDFKIKMTYPQEDNCCASNDVCYVPAGGISSAYMDDWACNTTCHFWGDDHNGNYMYHVS